jgi:hypothetical protein
MRWGGGGAMYTKNDADSSIGTYLFCFDTWQCCRSKNKWEHNSHVSGLSSIHTVVLVRWRHDNGFHLLNKTIFVLPMMRLRSCSNIGSLVSVLRQRICLFCWKMTSDSLLIAIVAHRFVIIVGWTSDPATFISILPFCDWCFARTEQSSIPNCN